MKVAVIDNTCNNGYVLIRYLNDMSIDTDLLLLNNDLSSHGNPQNDTYSNKYFEKIIYTGWGNKGLLRISKKEYKKTLDQYDYVIGSDYAPAIFYRIKRKLDVFFPHGTDVFNYPFVKPNLVKLSRRNIGESILAIWQRLGIKKFTKKIVFEETNEENESYFKKMGTIYAERIKTTFPFLYINEYSKENFEKLSEVSIPVKKLKEEKEFGATIVFHHCQQQWENPLHPLFNKGNDILINGFAKFIKSGRQNIKLAMIERGTDVDTSKRLISNLGIVENVIWLKQMPRKEIMACLYYSDIGVGELKHSWYTYSVVSEFLVAGKPVVHKCDIDFYKKIHNNVYPMISCEKADDIFNMLTDYFKNSQKYSQMGIDGKEWWDKNVLNDFHKFIYTELYEKNQYSVCH